MAETPEQIKRHIEALAEFEAKYGEFITAVNHELVANEKRWTGEEMAKRKREIAMLAVRADRAMKASGVGQYAMLKPPMLGGGVEASDLPSQVFKFEQFSYDDDGLSFQRGILDFIPSQLSGLEVKLEEAEAAEKESTEALFGEVLQNSMDATQDRREVEDARPTPQQPWEHGMPKRKWHENPWVQGIGVAVIGGGILAGIVALIN